MFVFGGGGSCENTSEIRGLLDRPDILDAFFYRNPGPEDSMMESADGNPEDGKGWKPPKTNSSGKWKFIEITFPQQKCRNSRASIKENQLTSRVVRLKTLTCPPKKRTTLQGNFIFQLSFSRRCVCFQGRNSCFFVIRILWAIDPPGSTSGWNHFSLPKIFGWQTVFQDDMGVS